MRFQILRCISGDIPPFLKLSLELQNDRIKDLGPNFERQSVPRESAHRNSSRVGDGNNLLHLGHLEALRCIASFVYHWELRGLTTWEAIFKEKASREKVLVELGHVEFLGHSSTFDLEGQKQLT